MSQPPSSGRSGEVALTPYFTAWHSGRFLQKGAYSNKTRRDMFRRETRVEIVLMSKKVGVLSRFIMDIIIKTE